jgi:hypothetical protein
VADIAYLTQIQDLRPSVDGEPAPHIKQMALLVSPDGVPMRQWWGEASCLVLRPKTGFYHH